jgi:restriction endonuclease Mrr
MSPGIASDLPRWRDVTAQEIADVIVKKIELEETEKKRAQQLKVERRAQEERARAAAARIKREHIRAEKQKLFEAQQRLEYWDELDGHDFEREFADLLRRNGWVANETRKSGDAGIDIEAKDLEGLSVVIECKRWKQGSKVGRRGRSEIIWSSAEPI